MEKINLWCKLVSAVSIISSVFLVLVPEGRIKKSLNTLLSTVLIFAFLLPFGGNKHIDFASMFDEPLKTEAELENEFKSYSLDSLVLCAEKETEEYVMNLVSNYNVSAECKVKCEYADENIIIEKIELTGEIDGKNMSEIYSEIRNICTENTLVILNGDKYE
ncbi:MAG: hypothetical protein IJB74_01155 [Clostridia bacterium]|nr:hypothetical protein [Clostridia bacterium]